MQKQENLRPAILMAAMVLSAVSLLTAAFFALSGARQPAVAADVSLGEMPDLPETDSTEGGRKLIALTFDDGPRRSTTTRLLDALAERGVRATFFLIGEQIEGNEDLVKRMADEGHQIGVHTFDHVRLTGLNRADFDAQVGRTRAALQGVLGYDDFVLRPPYGITDSNVKAMAGAPIILWSIDPEDWKDQNTQRVAAQIVREAKDGAIILLHDIFPASVDAAIQVVDALHAQGYLFCTIEELFAERHIDLEPGESYWNAYP